MKNLFWVFITFLLLIVLAPNPIVTFAQVQTGSFEFEGKLRNYIVFLPQHYNSIDKLPLVFNLHGYTLSAQQQMDYSRMNICSRHSRFHCRLPKCS